ncbi:DUF4132 domain-containing protein [Catenuloplanes sp. NPDC051500]|uniref:DUF4132 domain-containing protein n=1 Tax=Catenuloplanes sp. NPDC051500 TaxID=3363959 RepID=UPI0037995271
MRRFVLPDENAWTLPEAFRARLHPRRGGLPVPDRAVPDDLTGRWHAWTASEEAVKIQHRRSERAARLDPALEALAADYGRAPSADPLAAAAAALTTGSRWGAATDLLADLWVAAGGAEFAARVVGEMAGLIATGALWSVEPGPDAKYERLWRGEDKDVLYTFACAVRIRLAEADDDSYARACDVLAGYRSTPVQRIVTSYLAPTRVDWVDEDCASAEAWAADTSGGEARVWGDHRQLSGILLLSASTVRHLELLHGHIGGSMFPFEMHGEVGTVLDGVGPDAAPVLFSPFYRNMLRLIDSDTTFSLRERVGADGLRLLAAVPTDDAFRLLCREAIGTPRVRVGALLKSKALTRFPVRALRILTELETAAPVLRVEYGREHEANPYESAIYTDLLGAHLLTEPRLLPAVASALPESVRARAQRIVDSGGAGIGTGWLALLDQRYGSCRLDGADEEKRLVGALAALPTEEAFGALVDRLDRKYVRPALLTAAGRDPGLALRVLAAKPGEAAGELLRNHVLAHPGAVADTLPLLDAEARARVEAVAGPAPSAGSTPPPLAVAPRTALPEWLVVPALPAVRLRDGDVLSQDAVRALCGLLAASKIAKAHPAVADVVALCERADLAALAWAVFTQWQAAQYPAKSGLAMVALALFGDDDTVPALTSLFPDWATGSSMRVRTGMDVLAAIGTDTALTHLYRLARKAKTAGFRRFAQERLDDVAAARGLEAAQLADRIVPDLGLDADGGMTLDYGPRRFTARLDERLQPWIADVHGTRLARLPRPAATDDADLAADAARRFAALRKDAKAVASERIRAIEEAMVTGRRWTAAEFHSLFLRHPLMWHLTHRLLWATFDGEDRVVTTFRVAEDRTLADVDDKTTTLDPAATVGLPHPWHLGGDSAVWGQIFADYAIIQPFPQLGRERVTLPDTVAGMPTTSASLFALSARGWQFAPGHQALLRDWPGGLTVEVAFSPGYHWQSTDLPQRLDGLEVRTADGTPAPGGPSALGPIALSEVARDVRWLAG